MMGKQQNGSGGGGGGGGGGGKTMSKWLNHLKIAHLFMLMRFPKPRTPPPPLNSGG